MVRRQIQKEAWGAENRAKPSQAEGRWFESRFPLQNTYTLMKAGHPAQPFTLPTRQPSAFWAEGLRSSAGFGGPGLPLAALPETDGVDRKSVV
jgi:hypothetical protein